MDHRIAGNFEGTVASAVVLKGRAAGVPLPAIELDKQEQVRPRAVDPVALGAEENPVVEAGQGQVVSPEEWSEAFLEPGELAAAWLFFEALEGEAELPRTSFSRIAFQQVGKRKPIPAVQLFGLLDHRHHFIHGGGGRKVEYRPV